MYVCTYASGEENPHESSKRLGLAAPSPEPLEEREGRRWREQREEQDHKADTYACVCLCMSLA